MPFQANIKKEKTADKYKMKIERIKDIIIPILKKHEINRAGLFGSYPRRENSDLSDIDILVELNDQISLLEFVKIKYDLEDSLQIKVDLVEYQAIKPVLRDKILSEEVRLYG